MTNTNPAVFGWPANICRICFGDNPADCPDCSGNVESLPVAKAESDPELLALLRQEEDIERQIRR